LSSQSQSATIFDTIAGYAARQSNRPAILASGLDPLSFGALVDQIENIWETLGEAGVGLQSHIGIALPTGPESALLTVAVASRAAAVPLNPLLSPDEFERELIRLSIDALILPNWTESPARSAANKASFALFEMSKARTSLATAELRCLRKNGARCDRVKRLSPLPASLLLRTSATTGPSKLVPVTAGNLFDLARKLAEWFRLSGSDRAACVLPTYYAAGSKLNVLVPMLLGESIAIPAGVRSERLADWITDLQPTWFSAGPTFLRAVLDELKSGEMIPKHSLRFITAGSAHLPERLRTELEDILACPILEVYGISEAGVMAANPAPPAKRKPGTAGLIARGEVLIRGITGETLPRGEIGEIFVGGPGLMPGYINAGEPTGANASEPTGAGLEDGWLRTGDIGCIDEDEFLTIIGREKEIINRGGEKVSPHEVENALLLHPAVSEAAVFPVPHPRLGENVAAAVVLKPNTTVTSVELREFLRNRLAAFKRPQRIDIVISLPKTSTGKLVRKILASPNENRERSIEPAGEALEFQIADIWRCLLARSDIGVDDDFFEAGGDSLLASQMLLEVEAAIGHRVSISDLAQASTIRELTVAAAEAGGVEDEIVMKVSEGTKVPFFFCHGDYNTRGFYALKLASLIEADHPMYLLHPIRDVHERSDISIEELARLYVPRLTAIQSYGSFRIGGFCNGGLLAWEIARQLIQSGRTVESIVLINTISLNARFRFRLAHRLVRFAAALCSPDLCKRLRHDAMLTAWIKFGGAVPPAAKLRGMSASMTSFQRRDLPYGRAMANYDPPKLPCDLTVVLCEQDVGSFRFLPHPWAGLARTVRRVVVPGAHFTCITTHVDVLAKALAAHLRDVDTVPA
jgi:oxalate---CoA ligase